MTEGVVGREVMADWEGLADAEGSADWEDPADREGSTDWEGSADSEGSDDWEGSTDREGLTESVGPDSKEGLRRCIGKGNALFSVWVQCLGLMSCFYILLQCPAPVSCFSVFHFGRFEWPNMVSHQPETKQRAKDDCTRLHTTAHESQLNAQRNAVSLAQHCRRAGKIGESVVDGETLNLHSRTQRGRNKQRPVRIGGNVGGAGTDHEAPAVGQLRAQMRFETYSPEAQMVRLTIFESKVEVGGGREKQLIKPKKIPGTEFQHR
jgi:hypothetical protein